jgi:hypothetical protein
MTDTNQRNWQHKTIIDRQHVWEIAHADAQDTYRRAAARRLTQLRFVTDMIIRLAFWT